MHILVIGLGSMGKRRMRIIKELYPEFQIAGVDNRDDRRKEVEKSFNIMTYKSLADISEKIDCAFICSSPLSHSELITECLNRNYHVFTELNLVSDAYEQNMELAEQKKCILFLSSTFLYREEIRYIRSKIIKNKRWNYIYHVGQYLPSWHPWEKINDFFIGNKRTNGCREILAIELPWLISTFGSIKNLRVLSDKMTSLGIDFDDNYLIEVQHKNGNRGLLMVDVVTPVAVRKFEAYAENAYISWNGTPNSIKEFDQEKQKLEDVTLTEYAEHIPGYSAFIVENAYKNEIRAFFEVIAEHKEPIYGFKEDLDTLNLIDSIGA